MVPYWAPAIIKAMHSTVRSANEVATRVTNICSHQSQGASSFRFCPFFCVISIQQRPFKMITDVQNVWEARSRVCQQSYLSEVCSGSGPFWLAGESSHTSLIFVSEMSYVSEVADLQISKVRKDCDLISLMLTWHLIQYTNSKYMWVVREAGDDTD